MLKLSFLLIGPRAFKSRWYVLSASGLLLIIAALFIAFFADADTVDLTGRSIGAAFILAGIAHLRDFLGKTDHVRRLIARIQSVGLIILGTIILDWPIDTHLGLPLLFGLAFALNGLVRIAMGPLLRLRGWRAGMVFGIAELGMAALVLTGWPLPQDQMVALCIGLVVGLTGGLLLRIGLMFRTLEAEAAILNLPIFAERGWYDSAPVLVETGEAVTVDQPMLVHVWTPAGSVTAPERRLLIDRYVAAVDKDGAISTGHAALEMPPSLYISHYPEVLLECGVEGFLTALRATSENDAKGKFQPSYAYESDWWCPADAQVSFRNYDPRRLRAFWSGYRQDDTYNLVNRNCSVVVAHAMEAALEGALDTRRPWLRLLRLLANPDIWLAAMIRGRARMGTWTPGLVLDYAHTLARLVERRDVGWRERFRHFLRRLRPGKEATA